MEEVLKSIVDYGVSIIIVALFLWDWVTNKKSYTETLNQIKDSNKNIAESNMNISKSLDIIQSNQLTLENKVDRNYEELVKEKR